MVSTSKQVVPNFGSLGTVVWVTNLENGKSVVVRIVDRLPSKGKRRHGAIIDVSRAAARILGFGSWRKGVAKVRVEVVQGPGTQAHILVLRVVQ